MVPQPNPQQHNQGLGGQSQAQAVANPPPPPPCSSRRHTPSGPSCSAIIALRAGFANGPPAKCAQAYNPIHEAGGPPRPRVSQGKHSKRDGWGQIVTYTCSGGGLEVIGWRRSRGGNGSRRLRRRK